MPVSRSYGRVGRPTGRNTYYGGDTAYTDYPAGDGGLPPDAVTMGAPSAPPQGRSPYVDTRQPYYGGGDPTQMFRNDRQRAAAMGDMMEQEIRDFGADEDAWRRDYRRRAGDAYAPIAAGEGGYRQNEQADILGRDRLDGMQLRPDERESFFQTDAERDSIAGNPDQAGGWFDPEWLDGINTESNQRIRESVGDAGRDIRSAYDGDALSLSRGYRGELQDALDRQSGGVRGALDRGASGVRGAINRDRLTLDPTFANDYQMTDRDVNDTIQEAALTQGNVSAGRADAIRRAAAGSGMSPLALTAGINELTTRGDQQANRAMLNARIAARGEQAGRRRDVEGMRLDAERGYAGMKADAEMGLSGREAEMAMGLGDREYGARRDYERERLGTERDKGDRQYRIATNVADRNYDAVNQSNANNMNNARYIGEQGEAVMRRTDDRRSARASELARARQEAARYGSEVDFDRQRYRDEAITRRTAGVGDARRGDEREYRGYLAGQQAQANDNVTGSYDRRIRNYGQSGDQVARASQGAHADQQGGFWRGVGNMAIGAAIGAATGGVARPRSSRGGSSYGDGWGG